MTVSAPGKLMIAGEYVVLDGAEALVAAVSARVTARWTGGSDRSPRDRSGSPGAPPLPPEVVLTLQESQRALGTVPMELEIDTSALRHGERKLGLGSSAAAAVAAAGSVVTYHGGDPANDRRRILKWALDGHRAVAPQGSGADVAASALGGLVRFKRDAVERAEAIAWPDALLLEVVWTGEPARTSDLVARVRAMPDRERASAPLERAAERLIAAIAEGRAADAAAAANEHCLAMQALGEAAGAAIVTEPLERARKLALEHHGGAKPSGAGGGDVAIAFFADPDDASRFRARCPEHGLTPLSLTIGASGVRVEGS